MILLLVLCSCSSGNTGKESIETPVTQETESEEDGFNYINESFMVASKIVKDEGWLFYTKDRELRKCRFDLTEEMLVFSEYSLDEFVINQGGYTIQKVWGGENDFYRYDYYIGNVRDNSISEVSFVSTGMSRIIGYQLMLPYKDIIIVQDTTEGSSTTDVEIWNLEGMRQKKVFSGKIDNISVIEDAIYYLPIDRNTMTNSNTVMRYDIKSGKKEAFIEFEVLKADGAVSYSSPDLYFSGRNILIRTGSKTFITSIDDASLKELDLEIEKPDTVKSVKIELVYTDDGNLYFSYYFAAENDTSSEKFGSAQYYIVKNGSIELIASEREYRGGNIFISDGYLYYFDENEEIAREEL